MELNEKDLLIYFQYLRLIKDKEINDINISKNTKYGGDNFFTKTKKGYNNWMNNYEKKNIDITNQINKFNELHTFIINDAQARELVAKLFSSKTNSADPSMMKIVFASTIIMDAQYNYSYIEEGLSAVSQILYGDPYSLCNIKSLLEQNYKYLMGSKTLSNVQKTALLGFGIASAIGIIAFPVIMAGGINAAGPTTAALLAAKGFGDMQLGVGVIAASSVLIGAAITGLAYGGMRLYNKEQIKRDFRKLKVEEQCMLMSIQLTYIQGLINNKRLGKEYFKTKLDEIVKSISELKSDLDYFYFVERENLTVNAEKMKMFHKFDSKLAEMLC